MYNIIIQFILKIKESLFAIIIVNAIEIKPKIKKTTTINALKNLDLL